MRLKYILSNISINILSFMLPFAAGFAFVPKIISLLGVEYFSILSLSWVMLGYFSIFDFGLGKSLTRSVSARMENEKADEIPSIIFKTLLAMACLALAISSTVFFFSSQISDFLIHDSELNRGDAKYIIFAICAGIPAVVLYSGIKGIADALGFFVLSSAIRSVIGVWTFASPIFVYAEYKTISSIVLSLVAARYISLLILSLRIFSVLPSRKVVSCRGSESIREVFQIGGWMTVSNIISPITVYTDRFLLSYISGVGVVAYYTTPYDLLDRMSFIPSAVFTVVFPLMTAAYSRRDGSVVNIYLISLKYIMFLMAAFTVITISASSDFLRLWIGAEFSEISSVPMNYISIGFFFNIAARPAYNAIEAAGRSDVTAKLHLVELFFYVPFVYSLICMLGIVGAAIAWTTRAIIDMLALHYCAGAILGDRRLMAQVSISSMILLIVFIILIQFEGRERYVAATGICIGMFFVFWKYLLSNHEKYSLYRYFKW